MEYTVIVAGNNRTSFTATQLHSMLNYITSLVTQGVPFTVTTQS